MDNVHGLCTWPAAMDSVHGSLLETLEHMVQSDVLFLSICAMLLYVRTHLTVFHVAQLACLLPCVSVHEGEECEWFSIFSESGMTGTKVG